MFLNKSKAIQVGSDGDPESRIAIIGEAPGAYELREGKPFVGPAGRVFEQCLHNAGLIRGELYITNLIKEKITNIAKYYNEKTKRLTDAGQAWANQLYEELENVNANILVPLGNPALAAIMGEGGIMRRRGYLAESSILNRKFLPTIHPSAALRGNYIYRHFITADFKKAAANCDSPALSFPEVEIEITNDFEYAKQALEFLATKQYLSVDIEVMNFEVSCIGFCYKPNHAIVIPMYGGGDTVKWSFEEELYLWERIAEIMENPEIKKLGQNFIFDMQFLLHRNGIVTRGAIDDLMIMNSLTLSDFPKSLEFLVSVHCNRPYWKDMVKWKGADIVKRDS